MKKITYYCDKCKRQIGDDEKKYRSLIQEFDEDTPLHSSFIEGPELCRSCADELAALIWKHIAPERTPEPAAEEESKKENRGRSSLRQKLDLGKMAALHKAGWSNVKIAKELGTSDMTVAKYLPEALEALEKANKEGRMVRSTEEVEEGGAA